MPMCSKNHIAKNNGETHSSRDDFRNTNRSESSLQMIPVGTIQHLAAGFKELMQNYTIAVHCICIVLISQ
jgi:hypothetical protein